MAHSEQFFAEILSAESFVDTHALAAAALHGVPRAVRAETWKYLLSVCKPDRSQELSAEREQLKDYLRHDEHNAEVVQRVRAELRRYSRTCPFYTTDAADDSGRVQLGAAGKHRRKERKEE